MHNSTLHILDEDKKVVRKRIAELEREIQELGPEFYDVFNQTSETWHDNAPFDILRDRQSVLSAELQNLKAVIKRATISIPKPKREVVGIGARVIVNDIDLDKEFNYLIAGDWTCRAGEKIDGATVVSVKAPIAQALIGRKVGEKTHFKHDLIILQIVYIVSS